MKSQKQITTRLAELEIAMSRQVEEIAESGAGFGGYAGLFWDKRCVERRVLREILEMPREPFNPADTMAGW